MSQTAHSDEVDRWRSFRIADTIGLRYRPLTLIEQDQWYQGELVFETDNDHHMIGHEISTELERLKSLSPGMVTMADLLNQKLDMFSQHAGPVMDMGFSEKYQTVNVNLSAYGLAFPVDFALESESLMLIDLLLASGCKRLLAVGRVVDCNEISMPGRQLKSFRARINYECMDAEVGEELMQYILLQQRRIVAAQRLSENQSQLMLLGDYKKS